MTAGVRKTRRQLVFLIASLVLASSPLRGEERLLPVARVTIYPGDQISDAMLEDKSFVVAATTETSLATSRSALIGKIARRTLLPGAPIPSIAVDIQKIIRIGSQVKIVFSEGGMLIVAFGVAQQAGAIGDVIRVRNQDSGLFVSGRIQPDGSIRVSEG